ncbi:MAG TPA: PLP-dependent aminotransferase family protein [Bacillota bacterium]|nr:PLP-dependent aminotransferase family protein [Bacillota bacterium]
MSIGWQELFARRARCITGSQIRQYFSLTEKPEIISFAGGFPESRCFPGEEISRVITDLITSDCRGTLQYTPTEGNWDLRTYLAGKMQREGSPCGVENIIIVDGSQQGLDLICRLLINPGEPVLVEEPAYIGGMGAITSYGGIPVGIPMDSQGIMPDIMEKTLLKLRKQGQSPKVFYTVANFHNPTGYTTSLERRKIVMELARRYNLIIIEDNPYGELCYEGEVPPSYISLDREGRVAYLGSYSKTFIPGIRIGWIAGAVPLIEKICLAKQTADLCSNSLGQRLACHLSREGYLDRHVKRLIGYYRRKRDAMLAAMEQYFPPEIKFSRPGGGFFTWVTFPRSYPPARELLMLALERKVAFVHGEGFFSNGGGTHCARFSFSQASLEDIDTGIRRLGELFYEVRDQAGRQAAHG